MKLVKLVIVPALMTCMFVGVAFGQDEAAQQVQNSLQACGSDGAIIAESSEDGKLDMSFTSSESMAKCFNDINDQMSAAGWERSQGENNVYRSDFYRIAYTQAGKETMLMLRQSDDGYRVLVNL